MTYMKPSVSLTKNRLYIWNWKSNEELGSGMVWVGMKSRISFPETLDFLFDCKKLVYMPLLYFDHQKYLTK